MYPAQRPVEGPAAQEQSPPPLLSSPRQLLAGILQCRCCGRGGRRGIGQRRAQRVARVQRSPAECATALMPVAPQPLNACCCCARQAGASWGSAALWLLLGCLLTAACWAAGAVALRTHRRRHSAVQVWSSVLLSCSALLSLSPRPAECSAVSQSCRRCSANNVPLSCQLHVHPHVMARTASHGSLQGDLPLRPSAAVQTRSTRPLRLEGFCPPPPLCAGGGGGQLGRTGAAGSAAGQPACLGEPAGLRAALAPLVSIPKGPAALLCCTCCLGQEGLRADVTWPPSRL